MSQFNLKGRIQKVEYENLPMICFGCGKFGHYKDACPDSAEIYNMAKDNPIPPTEAKGQTIVVAEESNYREPKFGSWMVMACKRRLRKVTVKDNPKNLLKRIDTCQRLCSIGLVFWKIWITRKRSLKITIQISVLNRNL